MSHAYNAWKCLRRLRAVSPHIRRRGSIARLLQIMALTFSGWKPIHRPATNGDGREGVSQEAARKAVTALYFIVLKSYSSRWCHCQDPCLYIHGGIKPMPNSFRGVDTEKWPIMKTHRQTADGCRHVTELVKKHT